MSREYSFNLIFRILFLIISFICVGVGFLSDGVKLFGTTTDKGAFKPILVDCYENCGLREIRYRWKIKYEFWVDKERYKGSKFLRGSDTEVKFKKEIGYIPFFPRINWLETDGFRGINCLIGLLLGQSFVWLAFKKKRTIAHDINRNYNGIFYSNTGILPVRGMNTELYLHFLYEQFKLGFERMFIGRVMFFIFYMFSMWVFILWAKSNYPHNSIITVISFLTYAQAGLHGNFLDIVGGLLGKIFFVTFFIQIILEGKYETNYFHAYPPRNYSLYCFITDIASFVFGLGLSLVLFKLMTANYCYEDAIIGLIMYFICWKAQKNLNNPLTLFLNSFVYEKPLNPSACRTMLMGGAAGFLTAFILIWTPFIDFVGYLMGTGLILIALLLFVVGLTQKKDVGEVGITI